MKRYMKLGDLIASFELRDDIVIDEILLPFMVEEQECDIQVTFRDDWEHAVFPKTEQLGNDLLQEYYREGNTLYALSILRGDSYLACARWQETDSAIECFVSPVAGNTLATFMRYLPMRYLFMRYGILFLHSSQIAYREKGILFTAPSGTGKTTQAKLWNKYLGAEMICNDRTMIRKRENIWKTFGHPIDGSEPVRSNRVFSLGCIVVLSQGMENCVERLKAGKAMRLLMEQMVIDNWDVDRKNDLLEQLVLLLQEIPVYHYRCTKEPDAVTVLEQRLREDGVWDDEHNSRQTLA